MIWNRVPFGVDSNPPKNVFGPPALLGLCGDAAEEVAVGGELAAGNAEGAEGEVPLHRQPHQHYDVDAEADQGRVASLGIAKQIDVGSDPDKLI